MVLFISFGLLLPIFALAACPTECPPTVDLRVQGSDGPIYTTYNSFAILSWTSTNANSCQASGDWSGSKPISGSESTGNLTSSKTYTLTCTNASGSASDCVIVNVGPSYPSVANAGTDKEVYENNSISLDGSGYDPQGNPITYSWYCNGGTLSNYNVAQPIFYAPSVSYNTTYTCTLSVTNSLGFSASDKVNILVRNYEQPSTLSVSLNANPSSGCSSLNNVDLTANVYGPSYGYVTYYFDCTNNGNWEKITTENSNSYTAYDLCNYYSPGNYYARVRVENQGMTAENTTQINVSSCYSLSLTINKLVRNLSDGTVLADSVLADPGEVLSFSIQVTAGNTYLQNVIIKDTLPDKIAYRNNSLKIDSALSSGDILSGLNIGNLSSNQTKTVTFDADILGSDKFNFGETQLINSVIAYSVEASGSDTAKIIVTKKSVAGAATGTATGVSTGLTNNIFVDSFFLPLLISVIIIWLLRSRIIRFEEWLDSRKNEYKKYKSQKTLQTKIAKTKIREFLQRKVI